MKRLQLFTTLALALALPATACTSGKPNKKANGEQAEAQSVSGTKVVTMDEVDDSMNDLVTGERYRILFDEEDMAKGDAEALVTIVEYSDFQCPYCSRFTATIEEVMADYPTDVKVVFKQFPLEQIHPNAMLAAKAALAANAQGVGWELHDKMFANAKSLDRASIEKFAEEAGVADMEAFKAALDDKETEKAVRDDIASGRKMGVGGTPTAFINGRPLQGRSPEQIKEVIEEEKKLAEAMIERGSSRAEIYARIMKAAKDKREAPKKEAQKRPGAPDPALAYAVPTDDRPTYGKAEALVTIVEFSDFQCPYCSRVNESLSKIKETYPDDVRIVFRNLPLPMHPQAPSAARAGLAAHRQGKFFEMHDKMFGAQKELGDAKYEEFAGELGLDIAQFKKDYADPALAKMVEEDMKVAEQFGARGTPAFFVNGRFISGAQPFEAFDAIIKEEKAKAETFMKEKGVKAEELYVTMSAGWEKEVKVPPPPPPADFKRREYKDKLENFAATIKGNVKNPPLTIVECSDFDCPYCKRGMATIKEVMEAYKDKAVVYFAHNPLPMHKNAEPAHRAAIAAANQGKFWEMHDKLFEDQKARTEADFEKYATELGLDMAKYKADFADEKTAQKVKDDMALCAGWEVRGVPGFIINGRLMSGAQPIDRFKGVLDEELAGGFEATQKKAAAEGKDGAAVEKAAPAKAPAPKGG